MANANKVVLNRPDGEEVLIDISGDSVAPETLGKGVTAHDKTGAPIVGTAEIGGGAPVEEKDVNFYDYDGTLLYSYTLAEIQALSELPPLPDRSNEGLTCQGWNWSLADLKTYAKPNDIMPYYITNDGKTWFELENTTGRDMTVTFKWRQYIGKEQPILDFGDGSATFTQATTTSGGTVTATHTYGQGKFLAKLSGFYHLGNANTVSDITDSSSVLLKNVRGGRGCLLYDYTFRNCRSLETITMAKGVSFAGAGVAYGCSNLRALLIETDALPSSNVYQAVSLKVISISNGMIRYYGFNQARSVKRLCLPDTLTGFNGVNADTDALKYVNIPNGTTSIPANGFLRAYSLPRIEIPASVTSIGANAFNACSSLCVMKFLPTTPPTVANANAFTGIPTTCIVEVPKGTLETYQAATNYSGIAAQMVESES